MSVIQSFVFLLRKETSGKDDGMNILEKKKTEELLERIDLNLPAPKEEPERQYYYMKKARLYVSRLCQQLGREVTFYVKTFGCQMNARDSEKLTGILKTIGYVPGETEDADFVVYNTCTVRENANNKVYGKLGYLHGYKKKHPHMMIALCGCMMQEEKVVQKLKTSYRFVDLVFGTHNIFQFAELIVRSMEEKQMTVEIWDGTDQIVESLPNERKYSFKSGGNIKYIFLLTVSKLTLTTFSVSSILCSI